jgi:hypothetical protein
MSEEEQERINIARAKQNKNIASFISKGGGAKKLFCNVCNRELLPDKSCGVCGVFFVGETQPRHETRIKALDGKMPGPREQFLSARPNNEQWNKPHEQKKEVDTFFKSLENSGFRLTSYTRTDE